MDMEYLVKIRSVGPKTFIWVLTLGDEDICFSPQFKSETKCVIEALFFGTVFRIEVETSAIDRPNHLTLVPNP
jgi:hypothetical protein